MESKSVKIGQMQGPMLFPVEREYFQQILRMLIRDGSIADSLRNFQLYYQPYGAGEYKRGNKAETSTIEAFKIPKVVHYSLLSFPFIVNKNLRWY